MNGMTVYDFVRIERELALEEASRRHRLQPDREPRARLWRRRPGM